jgi:hypothetical protein
MEDVPQRKRLMREKRKSPGSAWAFEIFGGQGRN